MRPYECASCMNEIYDGDEVWNFGNDARVHDGCEIDYAFITFKDFEYVCEHIEEFAERETIDYEARYD